MGFRVTRKCGFPRDPPEHFSFQGDGSPLFIVAPGQTDLRCQVAHGDPIFRSLLFKIFLVDLLSFPWQMHLLLRR